MYMFIHSPGALACLYVDIMLLVVCVLFVLACSQCPFYLWSGKPTVHETNPSHSEMDAVLIWTITSSKTNYKGANAKQPQSVSKTNDNILQQTCQTIYITYQHTHKYMYI